MAHVVWWWVGFNGVVLALLALDLGVFHRKPHEVQMREAVVWSVLWTVLALGFNAVVLAVRGRDAALAFLAGYLVERALSVDNLFVFLLVLQHFRTPAAYQHKVLFWGILGALVMRGALIAAGVGLIRAFAWVTYAFGLFLVVAGLRLFRSRNEEADISRNAVLRLARRWLPFTDRYVGQKFLVRRKGRLLATPLLMVLIVIEFTDLAFALDSIPAVLGITTRPFLVYSSNVLAILGLRSLYFVVAWLMGSLRYFQAGLSGVLVFVGGKMLFARLYEVSTGTALCIITAIILVSVAASLIAPGATDPDPVPSTGGDG